MSLRIYHEYTFGWLVDEPRCVHIRLHLVSRDREACAGSSTASIQSVDSWCNDLYVDVCTRWPQSLSRTAPGVAQMAQWDGCDAKSSARTDILEEAYCQNNANGTHYSTSIP